MLKNSFIATLRLASSACALLAASLLFPRIAAADESIPQDEEPSYDPAAEVDSDGDLIPDAQDPLPLVANVPVYWSVKKFALSRPSAGKPADTSWAGAPSLDIATVLPAPKVQSSITVLPLTSRKAAGQLRGHPFSHLAVFGTDAIRLGDLQRARAEAFLRGWRADGANEPVTLSFTVRFINLDSKNWSFYGLEVPVVLDGKTWAMARPLQKDHATPGKGAFLPASDKAVDMDFAAEVEASSAGTFLSRLAKPGSSPAFDFARATGLDNSNPIPPDGTPAPPADGAYSLTAAFQSILRKTQLVRIEGPDGLVWNWRVAPKDLTSGAAVTFGQWADGMNAVAKKVYSAPLFAFEGAFPISVAGWDNGFWDLYWTASRKGREFDLDALAGSRLNADTVLALSPTMPSALPPEGVSPIISHIRGVWFVQHGDNDNAIQNLSIAGRNGAPQGYSWCGHCKAGMPDDPDAPGANKADAARLYKLAADAGYAPGLAWHGRALAHGEGQKADKEAGVAALKKSAEQGFPEGRLLYALFLKKGVGVKADPAAALELLTQAAWQGSPAAMSALGASLLDNGSLEGRDWLEFAAENGDGKAAARLARFLRDGELGTTASPADAAKWLQRAADAGDAPSLVALGEDFRNGNGVHRNPRKAAECFRRAAEADNGDGLAWYALCLLEGNGVRRDVPQALELLARAADAGHANAQFVLGTCLFGGYGGTEPNKVEAMRRFMAAAAEQPAANVFLGVGHLNGLGVAKNEKKALECFKAAADRDVPAGILWLAHCYANGIGVKRNVEEARQWAKKAADLGIPAGRLMLLSIQE